MTDQTQEEPDTTEYRLETESHRWKAIKATVSRAVPLNDALVRRISQVSFGETITRKPDARGRISIPGADEKDEVTVLLIPDDEEIEAAADRLLEAE